MSKGYGTKLLHLIPDNENSGRQELICLDPKVRGAQKDALSFENLERIRMSIGTKL